MRSSRETVSTSSKALRNEASVDEFLNAAATETVPLFEHLDFEFLLEYEVFAPARRGREREFTNHQTSFAAFYTATTRMSTALVRSHENSSIALSGTTADSTNRRPETLLIGFSLISNTSLMMSSTDSSSRPPPAACLTPRTLSIRLISKRSSTTTPPRGTTIRQLRSTTTASAVHSSQPAQRSR